MLKKTITYTDFNGTERTEDFYFYLAKSELMRMEMGVEGGLTAKLNKIVASKSAPLIMSTFEDLIAKSYGEKTDDGRGFRKSTERSEAFMQTAAYDVLFMELLSDNEAANKFIRGIMPADLVAEMDKQQNGNLIP